MHESDTGASLDADELVATALEVMRECTEGVDDIAGIGVASMAEAGVPLDASGRPLAEIIAWADRRSAADADAIEAEVGALELFALTGLRPDAKYTLPKLRWLQRNRPEPMRRLHAWAGVADLLALRLTGDLGTDASLACRTLAFDLRRGAWDDRLLGLAGLSSERMPAVVRPGQAVGRVSADGERLARVRRGTPVAVAGHDHLAGAFGAGVHAAGQVGDSMGTAEVAVLLLDDPILAAAAFDAGLTSGIAAGSGRPYLLGNLPGSGAMLEWFASRFGSTSATPTRVPSGIVARPFIGGRGAPDPDPHAAASFAGLRETDALADIALAMVEGASYQLRWILETLERVAARPIADVTLFGGGARNATWVATKGNLNRWPTRVAGSSEATALGAAMIGAMAAGEPGLEAPAATAVEREPRLAAAYEAAYRDRYVPLASAPFWPAERAEVSRAR